MVNQNPETENYLIPIRVSTSGADGPKLDYRGLPAVFGVSFSAKFSPVPYSIDQDLRLNNFNIRRSS